MTLKNVPIIVVAALWLEPLIEDIIDSGCNDNLGNPIFIISFSGAGEVSPVVNGAPTFLWLKPDNLHSDHQTRTMYS
jgi:hypothetical protein